MARAGISRDGRVQQSLPLTTGAAEQVSKIGWASHLSRLLRRQGEAHLLAGRVADAAHIAERAVEVAFEYGEPGNRAGALHLAGEIAERRGSAEADRRYTDALHLARQFGMWPLQARCHLGLGKLLQRTGRLEEAHGELATAVAMLREMGMTLWLPEAEAELARAGVSAPAGPVG